MTLFIKNAERIDHVSLLVKIADIVWTLQAASNIQFITSVTGPVIPATINNITISQQNEWPSITDVH